MESLKSLVSTKSTRLDRKMGTKTDPSQPEYLASRPVVLASLLRRKTVQPHYTTRLLRIAGSKGIAGPWAICARSKARRPSLGCAVGQWRDRDARAVPDRLHSPDGTFKEKDPSGGFRMAHNAAFPVSPYAGVEFGHL